MKKKIEIFLIPLREKMKVFLITCQKRYTIIDNKIDKLEQIVLLFFVLGFILAILSVMTSVPIFFTITGWLWAFCAGNVAASIYIKLIKE